MIDDFKRVLTVSFSMWCMYISIALLVVPELLYLVSSVEVNPYFTGPAALVTLLVGVVGRVIQQGSALPLKMLGGLVLVFGLLFWATDSAAMEWLGNTPEAPTVAPVAETAAVVPVAKPAVDPFDAIAIPLIAKWEGKRNNAYKDIVGVVTICYGSTRGIKMGMHMTDEECTDLLREEVHEYRDGWLKYVKNTGALTPHRKAAYTSLAFNVGIRGAGRSTATKRLNAGNVPGGCTALTWWNKAGGRVVRGLVRRRTDEQALCMVGL